MTTEQPQRLNDGIPSDVFAWAQRKEAEARKAIGGHHPTFRITNSQLGELEKQIELMKRDRPKRDDQRVIDYDINCARLKHEAQQKRLANANPVPITPTQTPPAPKPDERVKRYGNAPGVKVCPPPPKK